MARFLDSSVFLHAYLKPKRRLSAEESQIKKSAVDILERVEEGEDVATSVVHVSEVVNIVEARLGLERALELLENLLATENVTVLTVKRGDYEEALVIASRYGTSLNDAVAALLSRDSNIAEVYSFDKHFDDVPSVKRVAE